MRESIIIMESQNITAYKFWKLCTDKSNNLTHPRLVCSKSTLYKHYQTYNNTTQLPAEDDYGISVGAHQTIKSNKLCELNESISQTKGFAEKNDGLRANIVSVNEKVKENNNDLAILKILPLAL